MRGIKNNRCVEVFEKDGEMFYTDKWEENRDKILVQTLCYNEERLLPFFLDYYSEITDSITIIDTGSTDSSIDIIKDFQKCDVNLIQLELQEHREDILMLFRNHYWKRHQENYGWVVIVDIDEYLYSPIGVKDVLKDAKRESSTIIPVKGYDMVAEDFPADFTDIIEHTRHGFPVSNLNKLAVFDPNNIDIRYTDGCHSANPYGTVRYHTNPLYLLQYRFMGYDYFIDTVTNKAMRNSDYARYNSLGFHYDVQKDYDIDEYYNLINDVRELVEVFDQHGDSIHSQEI